MKSYLMDLDTFTVVEAPDDVMDEIHGYMQVFSCTAMDNIFLIKSLLTSPDETECNDTRFPNRHAAESINANTLQEFDNVFVERYLKEKGLLAEDSFEAARFNPAIKKARKLLDPNILERMNRQSVSIPNMYRTKSLSTAYFVNANKLEFLEPFTYSLFYYIDHNDYLVRMDELGEIHVHVRALPEFAQSKEKKFYTVVECNNRRVEVYGATEELVETAVRALRVRYPNLMEVK